MTAQEMVQAAVAEFCKSRGVPESNGHRWLEYFQTEVTDSAAGALVANRDMMFTFGKVDSGVAIVVHPRNPADALTMGQLRSILTGKAANWR